MEPMPRSPLWRDSSTSSTTLLCSPVAPSPSQPSLPHGVYAFAHPGGVFDVHLRSGGKFFAPEFPVKQASWRCTDSADSACRLQIYWGQYGQYDLLLDWRVEGAQPPMLLGAVGGDPNNWRKVCRMPLSTSTCARLPFDTDVM